MLVLLTLQTIAICIPTIKHCIWQSKTRLHYIIYLAKQQVDGTDSRKVSLHDVWHKREWAIWPDFNYITLKNSSCKKSLGVAIDNKLSVDEDINNICEISNKKLNALTRINHYIKQKQKKLLLPPFIISHFSISAIVPLFGCFPTKKSTKKVNAVHERF